jgi:hypothetical protein
MPLRSAISSMEDAANVDWPKTCWAASSIRFSRSARGRRLRVGAGIASRVYFDLLTDFRLGILAAMGRRSLALVLGTCALLSLPAAASAAARCPDVVDPADFASAATLKKMDAFEGSLGARPTASPAQNRFIDWLEQQMDAIPGVKSRSLPYRVQRWDASKVALALDGVDTPIASGVPYAKPTGAAGVTAPVVVIPADRPITAAEAAGKIVVRDSLPGSVPYSVFAKGVLGVGGSFDASGTFTRDFLGPVAPDLEAAAAAGAAGLILVRDVPRDQADFLAPYEGTEWGVPAVYVGADQAAAMKAATTATLTVDAQMTPATTRTVIATVPGRSAQKLVVESHTDGANALWDNGPIAMVAMARYLAKLPLACRPRTIEFAFVTGHLYQHLVSPDVRDGGAEQRAEVLDREYDAGKVAGVMVLEHLGAQEYELRDGRLAQTGRKELLLVPVSESDKLRAVVLKQIARHGLKQTAVITGADAPDPGRVPQHCSFGGEGTPYNHHLLPVVAPIAAPRGLFTPSFGLDAIDFPYMRAQTLAFTEVLLAMGRMPRADIAGRVTQERAQRKAGTPGCSET